MNMIARGTVSYLGSEFNDFLHAPVGVEKNGMPLSVLSALVRQNVDPWQEASQLAKLPQKAAVQRLALLIPELPDGSSVNVSLELIAARLIALLPHRIHFGGSPQDVLPDAGVITRSVKGMSGIILYIAFVIFALGIQWVIANQNEIAQIGAVPGSGMQHGLSVDPQE